MSKQVPVHFGGFARRPEPTSVSAQVARNLGLSSHAAVTSPRGDVKAAVARALSGMDALAEGETAEFAMLAPGDLIEQAVDALSALGAGPDYEPKELATALLPALSALGRAHGGADDDDNDAAAHGDDDGATRGRHGDPAQEEMARRCIVEGHAGVVVSHIRTR